MPNQVYVEKLLNFSDTACIRGMKCATKTADYTVTVADSGTLLIANKAGTQCVFTLPAVAAAKGCIWFFACLGATGMKIAGGTADKIVVKNDADIDAVSYETASNMIGAAVIVIGDGSNYYLFDGSGCTQTNTD